MVGTVAIGVGTTIHSYQEVTSVTEDVTKTIPRHLRSFLQGSAARYDLGQETETG